MSPQATRAIFGFGGVEMPCIEFFIQSVASFSLSRVPKELFPPSAWKCFKNKVFTDTVILNAGSLLRPGTMLPTILTPMALRPLPTTAGGPISTKKVRLLSGRLFLTMARTTSRNTWQDSRWERNSDCNSTAPIRSCREGHVCKRARNGSWWIGTAS